MSSIGSSWGIWDLQIQTILDSDYVELKSYYEDIKAAQPHKWAEFIAHVGSEADALLFDSKAYFNGATPSSRHRCDNYARTLFGYLKVFAPHLRCIGVTDHNHIHEELMDSLIRISKDYDCRILPGVEINADGVHILAFFPHPPCEKASFAEGIKAFLSTLEIFNVKTEGRYSLAQGGIKKVLDKILKQHGIYIFAHCNSDNGLFQERGKTDRTHLAEIYNFTAPTVLQTRTKAKAEDLSAFIKNKQTLTSPHIVTTASDGRALKDYGTSDDLGNRCFIKGAATVEGLRQAIFEPETRFFLGKAEPVPPIHRIDEMTLTFPAGTKLNEDQFCLAGNHSILFSPNYTCIIGGRGTGKSTLLNLLQEKIQPKTNAFFADRKLTGPDGKVLITSDFAKIDDDSDKKNIDFLSQNEIEKFATNAQALTSTLYARLEKENQNRLKRAHETLVQQLDELDKHVDCFKQRVHVSKKLAELEKEKQSQEKILKSFQSDNYKELSLVVATESEAARAFQSSKQRYGKLSADISKLIPQTRSDQTAAVTNGYQVAYEKMLDCLHEAKLASESVDIAKLDSIESQLGKALQDAKTKLSAYLSEKGLKAESQQDVADANESISNFKSEIADAETELKDLNDTISSYAPTPLANAKAAYEEILLEQIRVVNARLSNLSSQVKAIRLEFRFDIDLAKRSIFESVKKIFALNPVALGTKDNALFDALFCVEPLDVNQRDSYLQVCEQRQKGKELSKAQLALIELFQSSESFDLYKLVLQRALSDPFSFKLINVFYDGKPLAESSFGQRCTAAVVLLILLGNNPIIIDEPEGHLDSLLIANYLVELIKQTKVHRQIIFATHNANLVVNGDADLVYHLEMTETKTSAFIPVVLEDPEQRHRIVSLEGGHDAFRKRENKYRRPVAAR